MPDTPETKTEGQPKPASSKTQWFAAKIHRGITLPSGTVVDIELPDLPELAKADQIPAELLSAAHQMQVAAEERRALDVDTLVNAQQFLEFVLPKMLVSPKITAEEVGKIDPADKELLLAFCNRARDLDAVGHQLSGLETLPEWRRFRDFDFGTTPLVGD